MSAWYRLRRRSSFTALPSAARPTGPRTGPAAWHRLRPALRASARPALRTAPVDHHHSCSDSPSHPAYQHTQALRVTTEPFSGRWRRGTYRGPQSALVGAGPGRRKRGHAPEGDRRFRGTALRAGSSVLRALCGATPIPALSGRTDRHRINRGGDSNANSVLCTIVLVCMRYDQ
ncbi:transposase [Streptomyces sp. NPDC049951]|uniref:transposase n=1 Tax=Streptomyces TaxID=1883 RepID=UPI00342DFC6D